MFLSSDETDRLINGLSQALSSDFINSTDDDNNIIPWVELSPDEVLLSEKLMSQLSRPMTIEEMNKDKQPHVLRAREYYAKKKTPEKDAEQPPKVVTKKAWEETLKRFSASKKELEAELSIKRREREKEEQKECLFIPTVSANSKKIVKDMPKMMLRRPTKAPKQLNEYASSSSTTTSSKRIDTKDRPCICTSDTGEHTAACVRFAEACIASKSINAVSAPKRTIDDMFAYAEAKKIRNLQRIEIAEEEREKALTFSPRTNKTSKALVQAMIAQGRDPRVSKRSARLKQQEQLTTTALRKPRESKSSSSSTSLQQVYKKLHDKKNAARQHEEESKDEKPLPSKTPIVMSIPYCSQDSYRFVLNAFEVL